MSVEVRREVDTVIMEMDVAVAEKLLEVISMVRDDTTVHPLFNYWEDLRTGLEEHVRYPSPLYDVKIYGHPMNKVWSITYKENR